MLNHIKKIPHLFRYSLIALTLIVTAFIFTGSRYDHLQSVLASLFPSENIFLAKVISVQTEEQSINGISSILDRLTVEFMTGEERGSREVIRNYSNSSADPKIRVEAGETILVARNMDYQGDRYYMADRYRLPQLLLIALIFVLAILIFGGIRGLTSIIGLLASIAVLMFFIVPKILDGSDALLVSFVGAVIIALISLYLAHGFNMSTTIALGGTLITLAVALGLALLMTSATNLLGIATEESHYLKLSVATVSLRGLLLAGIMIGMLGVLDDVTIGQAKTVEEIKKASQKLDFLELYRHGISVGKEHIASLVNTLVLAYVGVSLPLFLLIVIQIQNGVMPLWLAVNGEAIAEELVRAIVGSLAIIFAVPITTFLAAYYYGSKKDGVVK